MIKFEVSPRGILSLQLEGSLASANVRVLSDQTLAAVHRAGELKGLLIQVSQFPPWRDFVSFMDHLRFIQEQKDNFRRVAVVTATTPVAFSRQLAGYFPQASVERFAAHSIGRAQAWLDDGAQLQAETASAAAAVPAANKPPPEPDVLSLDDGATEAGEEDDWFV